MSKHKLHSITLVSAVIILMLVSIAGAEQLVDVPNFGSNNHNDLNKVYENDVKTQDTAIEINPYDSEAWKNKGLLLVMLQKPEEALKAFNKAIEINPHYPDAWTGKGLALTELNKFDEAIKAHNKAIEINPQDSNAWDGKGLAFEGLNKPEEAMKAYDKAIEINPQDSMALKYKKALSLSNTGKLSDSVTESQDLVSQGAMLAQSGQYDKAMKVFDKAIESNPQNSAAWSCKGITLTMLGKYDEAMKAFDISTEINPLDSTCWAGKGLAFEGLNKPKEAIKAFEKAIEINPQNSIALKHKSALSNTKQPADLNTKQPTYRSTEQSAYQDSQWLTTYMSDSLVVNNDMKYLGTALKNIDLTSDNPDFTSTSTYANALYTDSQKAMDDSDLYNVSNDLQGAKDEHQLAMVQAQSAAVYIIHGVEEYKKGNFEAGNSEMKQAVPNIKSFREHDDRATSLSKVIS